MVGTVAAVLPVLRIPDRLPCGGRQPMAVGEGPARREGIHPRGFTAPGGEVTEVDRSHLGMVSHKYLDRNRGSGAHGRSVRGATRKEVARRDADLALPIQARSRRKIQITVSGTAQLFRCYVQVEAHMAVYGLNRALRPKLGCVGLATTSCMRPARRDRSHAFETGPLVTLSANWPQRSRTSFIGTLERPTRAGRLRTRIVDSG